jgi:hypothetical protein
MLGKLKAHTALMRLFEERLYEQVVAEMQRGERRNGIWAKAFADANGVDEHAKANYIRYRVQSLKDEILLHTTVEAWLKKQTKNSRQSTTPSRSSVRSSSPSSFQNSIENTAKRHNRNNAAEFFWWSVAALGVMSGASSVLYGVFQALTGGIQ